MKDKNREKREARKQRHRRVRDRLSGTPEKPRLCIYRSLGHIYAQVIDDTAGKTLASASSRAIEVPPVQDAGKEEKKSESVKMRRSRAVGKAIAEAALAKGITTVSFDRGGYLYHGRVAALAEEARKAGLQF